MHLVTVISSKMTSRVRRSHWHHPKFTLLATFPLHFHFLAAPWVFNVFPLFLFRLSLFSYILQFLSIFTSHNFIFFFLKNFSFKNNLIEPYVGCLRIIFHMNQTKRSSGKVMDKIYKKNKNIFGFFIYNFFLVFTYKIGNTITKDSANSTRL